MLLKPSINPARLLAWLAVSALLVSGFACVTPARALRKDAGTTPAPAGGETEKEGKDKDSPFKDWDETLAGADTLEGFFTVHRKHDDLWFEVRPDQLDTPFLMVSSVAGGLGKGWVLGGMPLDTQIWELRRTGNTVQVRVRNERFRAPEATAVARAVRLSYGDSVLDSVKIVSIREPDGHLLLDMKGLLLSDLPAIGLRLKGWLGSPASLDRERSAVERVKAFPTNVEIRVGATFESKDPKPLETVSDTRYLPVGLHYSLSELPADGYVPRVADDRLGYFLTTVKDFSRDSSDTFFVRYISRWRLEKQDPAAALSPPKEPIVFYLDHTIPEQYRPAIRHGTLMWNKAFEQAGFRDAIVVKDAPDDPDFDPEDARYNTIRWITSTQPSFGAIGPSRKDPRTGQILDADILIEAAMVQNVRRGYRNYVGVLSALSADGAEVPSGAAGEAVCSFAQDVEANAAVDAAFLAIAGEIGPGGNVPEEYVTGFLHWVTAHEVGHTLGLRHNFRASKATAYERLHDVGWTREHGLYNSVMEYPVANISLDRAAQGDYYSQSVGDYDLWAIRYGYTPFGAGSPDEEKDALRRIAEESTLPGHEYGTDTDAWAGPVPIGVDPDVNHFDLGSDPLAYARDRLELVGVVRERILDKGVAPGESYERLRNTFTSLIRAQSQALQIASKQIGGLHTSRSHRGDPDRRPPFTPVPADRQREAMAMLAASGFSDAAWRVPAETIDHLQPSHWYHWGSGFSGSEPPRLDYPYTRAVLAVQKGLLDRLFHPILLARIAEIEARLPAGEAYTLAEHIGALTDASFAGLATGSPGALSTLQRNLARAALDHLVRLVTVPPDGAPEDAASLSRAQLVSLSGKIDRARGRRGANAATKAFLDDAGVRIRRALDAATVLVAAPAGGH